MAAQPSKRGKSADAPKPRTIKTSLTVDVSLHARWSAAASLREQDRNAFAVEALRAALKGIVIVDRSRKSGDHAGIADEVIGGTEAA